MYTVKTKRKADLPKKSKSEVKSEEIRGSKKNKYSFSLQTVIKDNDKNV